MNRWDEDTAAKINIGGFYGVVTAIVAILSFLVGIWVSQRVLGGGSVCG